MDSTKPNTLTPRTDRATNPSYCECSPNTVVNRHICEELELDLDQSTSLLTRCRDAAGRFTPELYEDVQTFLYLISRKTS